MANSKFKEDLIKCMTEGYNNADGLFNFPDQIDNVVKERFIPFLAEKVETLAQSYVKEESK